MKTSIIITGSGIMSKGVLRNACQTIDSETKKLPFLDYEILFKTKKEAVEALSEAYCYLSEDKEDWKASCGGYRRGSSLCYDAGDARIVKTD